MNNISYEVWIGFDEDELELFETFDNKEDAFASAENCADFNDIVEIVEDFNWDAWVGNHHRSLLYLCFPYYQTT